MLEVWRFSIYRNAMVAGLFTRIARSIALFRTYKSIAVPKGTNVFGTCHVGLSMYVGFKKMKNNF